MHTFLENRHSAKRKLNSTPEPGDESPPQLLSPGRKKNKESAAEVHGELAEILPAEDYEKMTNELAAEYGKANRNDQHLAELMKV